MKKMMSALLTTLLFSTSAFPCTIFSLYPDNGQHWVGRTFDWAYGHAYVYTNKRNVTKTSVQILPTDVLSTWTSKYGSVTFNQFGREFPTGGMNEAGLMIDALELLTSVYEPLDSRPSFNELQFIQYILDNYASVDDISEGLKNIRFSPVGSRLHYFTCDPKACMTIEWIGGKLVTHKSENLPISGLANNTYDLHVDYTKQFITFGGDKPVVEGSKESLDRFTRSQYNAKFINNYEDKTARIFDILEDVGSVNNRWQIIYNQDEKIITFRTKTQFDKIRTINMNDVSFDCHSPVTYLDVDGEAGFMEFNPALNYALIKKSVQMQKLPEALAGRLAIYPNETRCND